MGSNCFLILSAIYLTCSFWANLDPVHVSYTRPQELYTSLQYMCDCNLSRIFSISFLRRGLTSSKYNFVSFAYVNYTNTRTVINACNVRLARCTLISLRLYISLPVADLDLVYSLIKLFRKRKESVNVSVIQRKMNTSGLTTGAGTSGSMGTRAVRGNSRFTPHSARVGAAISKAAIQLSYVAVFYGTNFSRWLQLSI